MHFADLTAPEIRALPRDTVLVVAPIAACEQHANHLPVFTDAILCNAVADRLEAALPDQILLLPLLWLGASEHHLPFGGTLTATLPTYETLLVELISPLLRDGFRRILMLNGHGGNIDPMRVALRRLDVLFPGTVLAGAAYWDLAADELARLCRGPRTSMGHACEIETALMLHLRPELVRRDQIQDDPPLPKDGLGGLTIAADFGRITRQGAIGYPESADAETGCRMLDAIADRVRCVALKLLDLPTSTPATGPRP
ncbi:MAG: creatininase [Isosphaeraceae bacterium]|jgi:creatinine amidohydrolase|nr:MAG: creatininase [Isosphaeraceae bacterium]